MMDKYTKSIPTVIAIALVSISFQISNTNLVDNAYVDTAYITPCMHTGSIKIFIKELSWTKYL